MKSTKVYILLACLLLLVTGAYFGYTIAFPEQRNIASEKAAFDISAKYLKVEMSQPATAAKYADQVVQTQGVVTHIDGRSFVMDGFVHVILNDTLRIQLTQGNSVKIKGRCIGYDDLLEQVKIDQATIVNLN